MTNASMNVAVSIDVAVSIECLNCHAPPRRNRFEISFEISLRH